MGVTGVTVHMESYEDSTSRQCTWSHTRTTGRDDVGGRRRRGRETLGVGVTGVTVHMSSYEDHAL